MHDNASVDRAVYVELDRVRAELDGAQERGNRVLRQRLMGAAVRDFFRRPGAARGQAFLRMLTLPTMSAKL
ncbi:MAG TPA: hypothetical protein VK494_04080 [Gemmatimonadaceae bacterium]|nr:hypothetical protein [Gemmatimonadaceae bacterium]